MKERAKSHLFSLVVGLLGGFAFMLVLPYGSTNPTNFGFYWSLFSGLFISFSVTWIMEKLQKEPNQ